MADEKQPRKRPQRRRETIPTNPKSLIRYEKTMKAIALRKRGYQWRDISKALETPASTVFGWVQKYLREKITEDIDELRVIELERLDDYEKQLREIAGNGGKGAPRAIEVALKVHERRSALVGLDAPEELNVNAGPQILEYLRNEKQDERAPEIARILSEHGFDTGAEGSDRTPGSADPGVDQP